MTPEEIRELGDLSCKYFNDISGIYSKMPVGYRDSISNMATTIDFIRKDFKKIVADAVKEAVSTAVKEAVGTLNSDREPVYPGDTALQDFLKLHLLNYKPNELFPIDETGKHPIASTSYEGRNKYRAKLLRMGITHYEDIHGYMTDSPIAAPYSLLVNDEWVECPRDFMASDFAGLSEDMKLLGLCFYGFPMKKVEESRKKRKANEPERHHIDDVQFNYSETLHQLRINGVQYLDEIDGYRLLEESEYNSVTAKGSVFLILKKYFNDLKATMNSYCVPFLPIEIMSKTK